MNTAPKTEPVVEAGAKGSPEQAARMREALRLAKNAEKSETTAGMEVSGRVAEIVGELPPEEAPAGAKAGRQQAKVLTIEERLQHLEANLPKRSSMEKEVKKELAGEIRRLEKEASRVKHQDKPHLLNNIYLKICELTGIVAQLVECTFEYLKSLWLRYVHGIVL